MLLSNCLTQVQAGRRALDFHVMQPYERLTQDAISYATSNGVSVAADAVEIIRETERLAFTLRNPVYGWTYLAVLLQSLKAARASLARHGADPDYVASQFLTFLKTHAEDVPHEVNPYDESDTYTEPFRNDRSSVRSAVIDLAIAAAKREEVAVSALILFEAVLDLEEWVLNSADGAAQITTPTLADVIWGVDGAALAIRFSDIRDDLGLPHSPVSKQRPVDLAPPSVRAAAHAFLVDNPNYSKNCFLIMPFTDTPAHRAIAGALRQVVERSGFSIFRADERVYSEDLLTNIQAYIYGCRFAIAVFERIQSDDFNPNVSLEVGYFLGLRKPVCLLKERTLKRLPSDLVGRLYVEFDGQDIESSVPRTVKKWLQDRGLVQKNDEGP